MNNFNLRYTILRLQIKFSEDASLLPFKASALRGGMGNVLLDMYCIKDKNCDKCEFINECVVNNIMCTRLKEEVPFLNDNVGSSYIIECLDKTISFKKGDILEFNITLFGPNIVNIPHIIYAFNLLGVTGGINNYKFNLVSIKNSNSDEIFNGFEIKKENIKIEYLSDYIKNRKAYLDKISKINFITPYRLKKDGVFKDSIEFKDIIASLNRRLTILNALEGFKNELYLPQNMPEFLNTDIMWSENKRYSNRQKTDMKLGGIIGQATFNNILEDELIDILISGEIVNIGKNISFGYGKYILE